MILTAGDSQKTDSKTLACAVCRRSFTPCSTARFCGPRCRQRAHRHPGLAPVDKLKSAKRNVSSSRSPDVSATRLRKSLPPIPKTAARQPALAADSLGSALHVVPDQHWRNMWRISFPDGRVSDMLNITRTSAPKGCNGKKVGASRSIGRHSSALRSSLIIRFVSRERLEETG
jgi:hypothetical protein